MHKSFLGIVGVALCAVSFNLRADYTVDIIRYQCSPEEQKVEVWYEFLENQQGQYFDKPLEGAYNSNDLVEWNQEFYRTSRPSKRSPITKTCQVGEHKIKVEIHFAGVCQDGAKASVTIFSDGKQIYKTPLFGGQCSSPGTIGPESVDKIIVTPRHVNVQSSFWYW